MFLSAVHTEAIRRLAKEEKLGLFRVSVRESAWEMIDSPTKIDSALSKEAMKYVPTIPPPGGFTSEDWKECPVYATSNLTDAVIQMFARFGRRDRSSDIASLSASFVEIFSVHRADFQGSVLDYSDLCEIVDGLPFPFVPGSKVGDTLKGVGDCVDAIRFDSTHGIRHETYVVFGLSCIRPVDRAVIDYKDSEVAGVFKRLEIEILE